MVSYLVRNPGRGYQTRSCFQSAILFLLACFISLSTATLIGQNTNQTPKSINDPKASLLPRRWPRDAESDIFTAPSAIPENVKYGELILDLSLIGSNNSFIITNNSHPVADMFILYDGLDLKLNPNLSPSVRKKFDFETNPVFEVDVVELLPGGETGDTWTVILPLSDVNDEPPKFAMEAFPYFGQVGSDAIPWTLVYVLTATDDDSYPDMEMNLISVEPPEYSSRFQLLLDSNTGSKVKYSIVVAGSTRLPDSQEISLTVSVQDRNSTDGPQLIVGKVEVLVGMRAPQFYSTAYTGYIDESIENNDENIVTLGGDMDNPLVLKAVNFDPSSSVRFRVLELNGIESTRFKITSDAEIVNTQVIDFERVQSVTLILEASNSGTNRSSTAQLLINIKDKNDHAPEFTKDNYFGTIPENIPVGEYIIQLTAGDKDSGSNQDLEFVLPDNENFSINTTGEGSMYIGNVKVERLLDFDDLDVPVLGFSVLVRDKGVPVKTSTAHVIVTLENVNDNPPEISVDGSVNGTISIVETLKPGSVVTGIQAWDKDWDGVALSFEGDVLSKDIFTIDPTSGVIKTNAMVDRETDSYRLTVVAVDDGLCCGRPRTRLTSSYVLTVRVDGINENKPEFESCASYDLRESVPENAPPGAPVITVTATDTDRGDNGVVWYQIDEANSPFSIERLSGEITVNGDVELSRGVHHGYQQVTVVGRNPSERPLMMGWCSFRVRIDDINDNTPVFAAPGYEAEVLIDAGPTTFIIDMLATDNDIGDNAKITYELSPMEISTTSYATLSIGPDTGRVMLTSMVDPEVGQVFKYLITATDQGINPESLSSTTTLTIKVVNRKTSTPTLSTQPPDKTEFFVSEAVDSGHTITTLTCTSDHASNNRVTFIVFNAETSITVASTEFGVKIRDDDPNTGDLVTLSQDLDYEERRQYIIHVVCQDFNNTNKDAQLTLTINLEDANDEIPRFVGLVGVNDGYLVGSVRENAPPGTFVTYVQAVDDDTKPLFKNITFRIVGKESELFSVQRVSDNLAKILTQRRLDRETTETYNVVVTAQDGAPSAHSSTEYNTDTRQILVRVTDENDNPPTFQQSLYQSSVSESAKPNQSIFSVTANDVDLVDKDRLDYVFVDGNTGGAFSVVSGSGEIRVTRKLDYESSNKAYRLVLQATDEGALHSATTTVELTILDDNDNPPKFEYRFYDVTGKVNEHDYSFTAENPLNLTRLCRSAFGRQYLMMNHPWCPVDQIWMKVNPAWTRYYLVIRGACYVTNRRPLNEIRRILAEIKVTATDRDQRNETSIRYSLLYPSIAMMNLFKVDPLTGDVHLTGVLDRDRLESFYTIAVVALDELENPLIGYTEVRVQPVDVNDKPVFAREDIQASVREHVPIDTPITTTMKVTDNDENPPNNTVKYQLVDQQPPSNPWYFKIDPNSGQMSTAVQDRDLDRELLDHVFMTVVASDEGAPPLSASATVVINILDINDNAPRFVQSNHNMTISENVVGEIVHHPIKVVDADVDVDNRKFIYRILDDGGGHFFVQSSSDDPGTAFLCINSSNPLDYEMAHRSMNIRLEVTDGDQDHSDTADIVITVEDYNDNSPVFVSGPGDVTLMDGTPANTTITTFNVTDADSGLNGEIVYSILRESDPRFEFYIHPERGTLSTWKTLDRETVTDIELVVIAKDKGEIPLTSSATLSVSLKDANDCAPQFKQQYRPQVEENVANTNSLVVEIFATDPDTLSYGPPFGFKLPDGCNSLACQRFSLTFLQEGDSGRGSARITTSTTFDRETQKEYHLPIVMWDMRGTSNPSMSSQTSTSTLTIVIGDANDNLHSPGHQDIHVFNYRGTKGPKQIGRVFAQDLDDWDISDKTFTADLTPNIATFFSVDRDTGMITMYENVPPTNLQSFPAYEFDVKVYDKKFDRTVTSTVSVTVEELTDEAVRKSGSVRLEGITAEEFVAKDRAGNSKYDIFRRQVSSILGYDSPSNVVFVSIQESGSSLDVRFSAHGSPYLNPSQVESALLMNRDDFETTLGVSIKMVPINLCMEEVYDVGCSTAVEVTQEANLVNTNGTSYVGVKIQTSAVHECLDCTFPAQAKCTDGYCYNGGTCIQDDWEKITCQCPPGFDKPRCQQRRHHFDGSSIAFYQSLSVSAAGRTMFDFITLKENGLIMYSGDVKNQVGDYIIVELLDGYPRLRINLGSAEELVLALTGRDQSGNLVMDKLNDGRWHHVDIDRDGQHIQLTVDKCGNSQISTQDWTPCQTFGIVDGPNILLNTPGFLIVGGVHQPDTWSGTPPVGFSGCLKDLVHNTKLYDLSFKEIPSWNSGTANCPREDRICQAEATCSAQSDCVTEWLPRDRVVSCSCPPGRKGTQCTDETLVKDLGKASFLKWQLGNQLIENSIRRHRLSMTFRTRQKTGTLFSMSNDRLDSILVHLHAGKLQLVYSMEGASNTKFVALDKTLAATGQWHSLVIERHGAEFSLSMDNGEGKTFSYLPGQFTDEVEFKTFNLVSSGARIDHVIQERVGSEDFTDEDLVNTCITDLRYNSVLLPMDESSSNLPLDDWSARLVDEDNLKDGCSREDCVPDQCSPDTSCFPLWEKYECRPNATLCGSYICHNGGVCVTVNDVSSCQCVTPWVGVSCNVSASSLASVREDDDTLAAGAIAGIVIGILLILILLLLLLLLIASHLRKDDKDHLREELDDDYFARENVLFYDEEGAGEKDSDEFNLTTLRRDSTRPLPTVVVTDKDRRDDANNLELEREIPRGAPLFSRIGNFLDDEMDNMKDGSRDHQLHFADEGSGSIAGNLSSLSSGSGSNASQDYDYLGGWGPKFSRLADMYSTGNS